MLTNQEVRYCKRIVLSRNRRRYWDFKEKPYFYEGQKWKDRNKKKEVFFLDIICMANNTLTETYIIMKFKINQLR